MSPDVVVVVSFACCLLHCGNKHKALPTEHNNNNNNNTSNRIRPFNAQARLHSGRRRSFSLLALLCVLAFMGVATVVASIRLCCQHFSALCF